jgi:hypothetical protein
MALVLATSVKARLVPPVLRPSPADPPSASLVEEEREDADTRGEGGCLQQHHTAAAPSTPSHWLPRVEGVEEERRRRGRRWPRRGEEYGRRE